MPRVGGIAFRCGCGCNVFHKESDPMVFICNSCGERYRGEAA